MTTLLQDSFNRANGAIGTPDVGGPYTVRSGAPTISGNRLASIGLVTAPCAVDLNMVITNVASVSGGIVFRYIDLSNYWYFGIASGVLQLFRHQGGTQRLVFNTRINNAGNQISRIVTKGKIIAMYLDSFCLGAVEDPYFSSATIHAGVWNTQPTTFDDLLITDDLSLLNAIDGEDSSAPDNQAPSSLDIQGFLLKGMETKAADIESAF